MFSILRRSHLGLSALWVVLFLAAPGCGLSLKEEKALEAYKQNSKSYFNNGSYAEAIDQCNKGLKLDPNDHSLKLTKAWALLKSGDDRYIFAARRHFEEMVAPRWFGHSIMVSLGLSEEMDFRVNLGLGQACYKIATLFGRKLSAYEAQIEEDPEIAELNAEEIEICRDGQAENLKMAIYNLEQTLTDERQKENAEAILTLGQVYAYKGDHLLAVRYLEQGLDLLEQSTSFQQERLDKDLQITLDGKRFYQREIRKNLLMERDLRGILASVYRRMNEFENALEQYDLLEKRDLFLPIQYYNRGITLQEMGRFREAILNFELFLSRSSVTGMDFDEDEHFHRAFDRIKQCRDALGEGSPAQGRASPAAGGTE